MKSAFSRYHPGVNFLYFALILICSMCFLHPVCLVFSLCGGVAWSVRLGGRRALRFSLLGLLPMLLLMWLVNVLFSHAGATILAYFPNGNPLTLESVLYGLAAAAMLASVIAWFSCYHEIMTSDKFMFLFGRILPALSLILSMVLRFVPRFQAQFRTVSQAQRCVGRDLSTGTLLQRGRHGVRILSLMVTWSLENAIETADSMKSRGYGLPGRTSFANFRMEERDRDMLLLLGGLGLFLLAMALRGELAFRYFPLVRGTTFTLWSATTFFAYLLLCMAPLMIELWEDRKWKHSTSNI